MRTTTDYKTIRFTTPDGFTSPEMSFEQFEKVARSLDEISSVVISQVMERSEVEKLFPGLLTQEKSDTGV